MSAGIDIAATVKERRRERFFAMNGYGFYVLERVWRDGVGAGRRALRAACAPQGGARRKPVSRDLNDSSRHPGAAE